ncbi:hypothetical protein [Pararhodobacter oceanensis]|uniref:hypothetical protein n=1 Tax=Pararhodobacter oceanensis TaxID=2172121 RepID=UPI0014040653|nr:hypothetical protein [Pararhodobacter oceanensis]
MKPNFALKLSNDGIELLHRDPSGWLSLGAVSFETDDVEAGCARLLEHAKALAPDGVRTKLVLPNSQLRYATVLAPGPTDEARRYQIEAEIEALTPYAIDEVVYDWSVEDDHALIVICAKETLEEAEGFCEASGFNPVSFVAAPEAGEFMGEPNLGLTTVAPAYLRAGETVQFDAEPVVVSGVAAWPEVAAAAKAEKVAPESGKPANAKPEGAKADTAKAGAVGAAKADAGASAKSGAAGKAALKDGPRGATAGNAPAAGAAATAAGKAAMGRAAIPPAIPPARAKVTAQPRPIEPTRKPDPLGAPAEPRSKVGDLVRRMGTRLRREQAQAAAVAPEALDKTPSGGAGAASTAGAAGASAAPVAPSAKPAASPLTGKAAADGKAPAKPEAVVRPVSGSGKAPVSPPVTPPVKAPAKPPQGGDASGDAPKTDAPKTGTPKSDALKAATAPAVAKGGEAVTPPISFASSRRRAAPVVAASNDAPAKGETPGGRLAVMAASTAAAEPGFVARVSGKVKASASQTIARAQALRETRAASKAAAKAAAAEAAKTAALQAPVAAPTATPTKSSTETPKPATTSAAKSAPLAGAGAGLGSGLGAGLGASAAAKTSAAKPLTGANSGAPATGAPGALGGEREKTEAEAMTIFGARGNVQPERSIGARGLMAGGGVLLLGVAAAVWFTYFNAGSETAELAQLDPATSGSLSEIAAPEDIEPITQGLAATGADSTPAIDAPLGAPAEDAADTTAAATVDESPAAEATQSADAGAEAPLSADPDSLLESLVQEALNEALPAETLERAEQVTGAATPVEAPAEAASELAAATQPSDPQTGATEQSGAAAPEQIEDSPQLATATSTATRRMSLPAGFDTPALEESAFRTPPPPPPFGTEFTFDANGLVEATPEGALTPSGVTVYARRPDVAPVVRPEGLAPEAAVAAAVAEVVSEVAAEDAATAAGGETISEPVTLVPDDTPRADPALADARPQPRSERVRLIGEELAPADTPDPTPDPADSGAAQQDAALSPELAPEGPAADAALASLVDPAVVAADAPPPGGVSLAALRPQNRPGDLVPAALLPDPALDTSEATPEAVAVSRVPSSRPDDIAERAQAALAAAQATAEAERSAAAARAAAQPEIPSSASVARQATESDAINLGEVNLIGVFGTESARRALVRLSSGRVVRVSVGDRLDGGQVTAIGENELLYTRRGRNQRLEIGG